MKKTFKKLLVLGLSLSLLVPNLVLAESHGEPPGGGNGGGGPGGGSSAVSEWSAVYEFSSDTSESGNTYESTGSDENAILVSGGTVNLADASIYRNSSDSTGGDNSSFYGVGAAVLNTGGTLYISDSNIETDSAGGAGVFSYSDGVTYVANTVITTSQDTSGGIHVAGGGTLYAYNLDVETSGASSAAIRSDRGGGTMVVDGGTYTSNGSGSPAVYVTADIAINNAELIATGSEGLCLEGLNSVYLFNSSIESNMPDDSQNDHSWTIILYQSMSGDSEVGEGNFYMVGGSITSKNGGVFYTTNTESNFYLKNVTISASEDSEYLLRVSGNANQRGWGSTGSNGSQTNFTAVQQTLEGDIIWDSISELDLYFDEVNFTGAIVDDETYAGNGGSGYCNLYMNSESSWTVTGDSTVSNIYLENADSIKAEDGTVSIVGSDGTVYVEGDSQYTITVTGTYEVSEEVDFTNALSEPSFSDFSVEAPAELNVSSTSEEEVEATSEAEVEETTSTTAETTAEVEETTSTETSETSTKNPWKGVAMMAGACALVWLVYFIRKKNK